MSKELSLIISNPNEGEFLKSIDWNKKEFMELVESITKEYEGLTYTEEQMKAAKEDRAKLNAMKKAISDRRIEVKKAIDAPYKQFEKEVKEVVALIEKPISMIDGQIKEFEKRQKDEKEKQIRETYESSIGELYSILPFEKVFDKRYLNQTYKLAAAQADMQSKIERVRMDMATIDGLDSKYKINAKDVYIKTLDLSKALAENRRLQELEEKLEEKRKKEREEAERRKKAEKERERLLQEEAQKREAPVTAAYPAESAYEPEPWKDSKDESVSGDKKSETKNEDSVSGEGKNVSNLVPNESEPVSMMGRVIQDIEQQAFKAATSQVPVKADEPEKKYRAKFYAVGTKKQLGGLTEYMRTHGIEYGKAEK